MEKSQRKDESQYIRDFLKESQDEIKWNTNAINWFIIICSFIHEKQSKLRPNGMLSTMPDAGDIVISKTDVVSELLDHV